MNRPIALILFLLTAPYASAEGYVSLFEAVSETETSLVQLWVNEFRASRVGQDEIDEYRLASINEGTLNSVRLGLIKKIAFNYSDSFSFSITELRVVEKDTNWYFSGKLASDSNSTLILSVFPNGNVTGKFRQLGTGHFIVTPTNVMPYHLVHLATGEYIPD